MDSSVFFYGRSASVYAGAVLRLTFSDFTKRAGSARDRVYRLGSYDRPDSANVTGPS